MAKAPTTSKAEFDAFREELAARIADRLVEETELTIPDDSEDEDLWEVPEVDSKVIIKVSGIVEEYLGIELPPEIIKSGGYPSVNEAVEDLMKSLKDLCPDMAQSSNIAG